MAATANNKPQTTNQPSGTEVYVYTSATVCHFTHNKQEYVLQYGNEYTTLPMDSTIILNLIEQKRLIKK